MIWRALKTVPKYLLVLAIIVGSTAAYYAWSIYHRFQKALSSPVNVQEIAKKVERIATAPTRVLLVDEDLYDFDTGALIFAHWLKGTVPVQLYWEKEKQTVLAQYEKGFVRYSLDGKEVATLARTFPFLLSSDHKWALFSKDKDVWKADIDWENLKFSNEKKITAVQSFNDNFFAQSAVLGTEKTLVVRVMPNLLRVDMVSGDVHITKVPLGDIGRRRSPNSRFVVGLQNGQFYCYDVDTEGVQTVAVGGRVAVNDFRWLDNDRCLALVAGKSVMTYDRLKNTLTEVAALPFLCSQMDELSTDGSYIFCVGRGNGALVDLKGKTARQISGGSGVRWIGPDVFAFSRELPDSDLRGTWFQKPNEPERRISLSPYIVTKAGPLLTQVNAASAIVFATSEGISRVNADGSEIRPLIKLARTPGRMVVPEERPW